MVGHVYQTVGFHFKVIFGFQTQPDIDVRFQAVSGLDVQMETESIKEGGENRFEHVVPVRTKYSDLVLKRGLLSPAHQSTITEWCKKAFDNYQIEPINLQIQLLNEDHDAMMKWDIMHAWPKNWKVGELNAEKSEVVIETLELNYNMCRFNSA